MKKNVSITIQTKSGNFIELSVNCDITHPHIELIPCVSIRNSYRETVYPDDINSISTVMLVNALGEFPCSPAFISRHYDKIESQVVNNVEWEDEA